MTQLDRLKLNKIDDTVSGVLRSNANFVMAELPTILDGFYAHMSERPEARRFFKDRAHMEHAKEMQLRHWRIILDARFDAAYEASVTKIGRTHFRLGLEPNIYIGGYSYLLSNLIASVLAKRLPKWGQPDDRGALQSALIRAAMLDMDYAISVYIDVERTERKKAMDKLTDMGTSLSEVALTVSSAAAQLEATARAVSSSVNSTAEEAEKVSSTAGEISTNVTTVASATEQLTGSVREIGTQVDKSVRVVTQASDNALRSVKRMEGLSQAAQKIGTVVTLINDIARQTNLLALNATIEAARAGDSGKGFAVVAQEVKALAEKTASATTDISKQIVGIQSATNDASMEITDIAETLKVINEIASSIAAAVEEQGAACQEIARSAAGVSNQMNSVSHNINTVSSDARTSSTGAAEVLQVATSLAKEAEKLRHASLKMNQDAA